MSKAVIGGRLYLPYQDDAGEDVPIASGEVVYKMSALTVDGSIVRVPSTVIASIKNGVLEPKGLVYGVWTAEIRPHSPSGYAKRIKFLADKPEMDLSEVIPIPIDGLEYVKGDAGAHITGIESDEAAGTITITLSDSTQWSFPLPHAALSLADRTILDEALQTVTDGTTTIETLAMALQESVDGTQADLQSTLQALTDAVARTEEAEGIAGTHAVTADAAATRASTSAQEALTNAQSASASAQAAQDTVDGIDFNDLVTSTTVSAIWTGTQAQYDALTPDAQTLYVIREA